MDIVTGIDQMQEPSDGIRMQQSSWTHKDAATDMGMRTTAPQQLAYVALQQSRQNKQIKKAKSIVRVRLSRKRFPESVKHIEDAIALGHPRILTIAREKAKLNRKVSLKRAKRKKGRDNDEYPPAMTAEGGKGASVRSIPSADNRGAGSSMGNQLREYPDGTQFEIEITE